MTIDINSELDLVHAKAAIDHIDPATIVKVYSGRPGCGCGCLGKYSTNPTSIKRIVTNMKKRVHNPVLGRANTWSSRRPFDEVSCGQMRGMSGERIYFVEDEGRYYWAFTEDTNRRPNGLPL